MKQNKNKTIGFQYDILRKGKVIESQAYSNKKGFDDNNMAHIIDVIYGKVREGVNFFLDVKCKRTVGLRRKDRENEKHFVI